MDFVNLWSDKTEVPNVRFVGWLGVGRGKFSDWKRRYGGANRDSDSGDSH